MTEEVQELRKRKKSSEGEETTVTPKGEVKDTGTEKGKDSKPTVERDPNASYFSKLIHWLWLREDASFLGIFRIGWGLIMVMEAWMYVKRDFKVAQLHFYTAKYGFHPKYYPFDFVEVMPYLYMQIFLILLLFSSIFITLGYKYRVSCVYFFFGISYLFLLDTVYYLNHIYLVIVISFVMIFLPCNCVFALDSKRGTTTPTVPKIVLFFVRAMLLVVYTYAGVVKINEDWLRAEPIRHWIGKKTMFGGILRYEFMAYVVSYGGLFYDLFVGAMLMWNPTFWIGILLTMMFHVSNKIIFNIGIFPYVMVASTSLFFRPDWPRKLFHRIIGRPYEAVAETNVKLHEYVPPKSRKLSTFQVVVTIAVVIFLIWWVLMPLRFLWMPGVGPQAWNENGHMFSWRMKLRDRDCHADYFGVYPERNVFFAVELEYILNEKSHSRIVNRPSSLIQLAHFLGDLYDFGDERPEIYVYADCSINYRPLNHFTNRTIDLGRAPLWDYPDWILPVDPLPEELYKQYPWNWKFDEDWWNDMATNNYDTVRQKVLDRKERNQGLRAENIEEFRKYIADRFYEGDISEVTIETIQPPKSKRVSEYLSTPRRRTLDEAGRY